MRTAFDIPRARLASFVAGLLLLAAVPSRAQSVHFQFTDVGAGYNAFGVYIGTYGGTWDYMGAGQHHVGFNCVDYFHEVTWGQQWDANISSLATGDISDTRHPLSLDQYREAAWLISNYSTTNVQPTQATIWNLFASPGPNWQTDPVLLAEAEANYQSFDYSDWYVVTDVNANGPYDAGSVQEFVVYDPTVHVASVPEPAAAALLGTGLIAIAGFGIRRRRRAHA